MRRRSVRILLACVLGIAVPAGVNADPPDAREAERELARTLRALEDRVVGDATALSAWGRERGLHRESAREAQWCLELRPDDAAARKAAGFVPAAGGGWSRRPGYREPENVTNARALPDWEARRAALRGAYVTEALTAIRGAVAVGLATREREIDRLVARVGSDERARAAAGEVRRGETWVLEETVRAATRRPEIAAAAKAALAAAPSPVDAGPDDESSALGGGWPVILESETIRIGSTRSRQATAAAVKAVHALREVMPLLLGPTARAGIYRLYAMSRKDEYLAAIQRIDGLTSADRRWYRTLMHFCLPDSDTRVAWTPSDEGLSDLAANDMASRFVARSTRPAPRLGLGQYATGLLLGTHYTTYVDREAYDVPMSEDRRELQRRLRSAGSDWLREARRLSDGEFQGARWEDLRLVLGKDTNAMTLEDLLQVTALAAFLIEGRPGSAAAFHGAGNAPIDEAVESSTGLTVERLDARLRRWLSESR